MIRRTALVLALTVASAGLTIQAGSTPQRAKLGLPEVAPPNGDEGRAPKAPVAEVEAEGLDDDDDFEDGDDEGVEEEGADEPNFNRAEPAPQGAPRQGGGQGAPGGPRKPSGRRRRGGRRGGPGGGSGGSSQGGGNR